MRLMWDGHVLYIIFQCFDLWIEGELILLLINYVGNKVCHKSMMFIVYSCVQQIYPSWVVMY